ncbi:MAG TPA: hypothetical protein VMV69_21220 [Pirellulales bacterium]|nr:hypothetical protein [Pirellulales bacterium]
MHTMSFQQTAAEPEFPLPLAALQRFLCHVLVNQIPDEGLGEVCENLRDAWDFYKSRPPAPALLESVREEPARFAGTYERPVFQATEE